MTIKEARELKGYTRKDVCDKLKIPYRTLQDWELENRTPPEWAEELIIAEIKRWKNKKN